RIFCASAARSFANASAPVPCTPSESASLSDAARACSWRNTPTPTPVPLSRIARWNNPFANGDAISDPTLMPPADSPKIVTRDGSPPKRPMRHEPERPEPIVDCDYDGALFRQYPTVVTLLTAEAGKETAAVNPHHH